jgi:hypothetical protein
MNLIKFKCGLFELEISATRDVLALLILAGFLAGATYIKFIA